MGSPPFLICKSCLVPLLPGPPAPGAVSQYSKQLHLRYFTYFAPGKGEPPHSRFTDGGKMQRAAFTPCAATKPRTRCLRPRLPLAVSGRLSPLLGSLKKKTKKKPKCPRPSAAERSREHLPFWNLLSLRPLCRVGTPGPFVGFSWLRPPRLSHLTPPSSFSYLRSLLEHLGKARGLGDVERHDQSAGSRSRALAEDPGASEKRAQLPGNVACGRLTLLLSLQPDPPFPRRPSL